MTRDTTFVSESRWARWLGRLFFVFITCIMLFLVWGPLLSILQSSFWVGGKPNFTAIRSIFLQSRTFEITWNTIQLGSTTTFFSLLIGVPLAFLLARYRLPWSNGLYLLLILPFFKPPVIATFSWMLALGRAGFITRLVKAITGLSINIYSFWGIVFAQTVHLTPFVFMLTFVTLRNLPDTIEESTRIHGIRPIRTIWGVVLPLISPSILGAALLVFMSSIEEISGPAFLGRPARFTVLSYEIYMNLKILYNLDRSILLAGILLLITGGPLVLSYWLTHRRKMEVITGRGEKSTQRDPGLLKWFILGFLSIYIVVTVIIPFGTLIGVSFMQKLGEGFSLGNLSLKWYYWILSWKEIRVAIFHSVVYSTLAATFAAFIMGLFMSYIIVRGRRIISLIYDFSGSVSLALPGAILGVGIYLIWLKLYPPITATMWVLIIAYTVRFLPYAVRSGVASLEQLSQAVEEAARIHGVSQLRAVKDIVLPLITPSLIGAWVLVFVSSFRELTASLMLTTGKTQVNSTLLFDFIDNGNYLEAAAHSIVILTISIIGVIIVRRFSARAGIAGQTIL